MFLFILRLLLALLLASQQQTPPQQAKQPRPWGAPPCSGPNVRRDENGHPIC